MARDLRAAIRAAHRRDEGECVAALAAAVKTRPYDRPGAAAFARSLIDTARQHRDGVADQLLHEYSLSTDEGVALMCLAEALPRIADANTADRLIRDKIAGRDWRAHLGERRPLFVNAASCGLLLTDRIVAGRGVLDAALNDFLARGSAPWVRKAIDLALQLVGERFVLAPTIDAAIARARAKEALGYRYSYDMLGEAALTTEDADHHDAAYAKAIDAVAAVSAGRGVRAGPGVSVKLSALHPRYERSQRERVFSELLPRLKSLLRLASRHGIGVNIDAEEADRLELSLDLFSALAQDAELAGWDGLGFVVQAYQKRALPLIDALAELAQTCGRKIPVRLVKGAYWDSEIKRTQVQGLADYAVFTRKAHTDLSYLACAQRLLAAPQLFAQVATHNANTLASVVFIARALGREDFEFQRLHGMGEAVYDALLASPGVKQTCRIYAPVGTHAALLPYLVRRLLENGANSSFVNRLADAATTVEALVEDPLESVGGNDGRHHPAIVSPRALYAPRVNSAGVDLAEEATIAGFEAGLAELAGRHWRAGPLLAAGRSHTGGERRITNPARRSEVVGTAIDADARDVAAALDAAAAFAVAWFATSPQQRAKALLKSADLLEENRLALVSLCIREAGKTWGNAVDELREAVDLCRYYAARVVDPTFAPGPAPGPVACISPWNFPLAIFVGQVAAALAAGSPVLAKPAEQTPLIAAFAVALLHAAGVPRAALQLLPGAGEVVGAALVADARVRGVLFTGSTEVARQISVATSAREVRLVAETGGQNAMIVDSTALLEQVVADVIVSAFDSAGQRCSSLRVLCLQREIATPLLERLKAALRERSIGDPARLSTDVGPVIDAAARARLDAHVAAWRAKGRGVFAADLPAACADGCFFAPTLVEIEAIDELEGEVFGPVLHVLRFSADRLDALIESINATGYGLTLGVHSRIDERVRAIAGRARVGNLYVNRPMTGAVVGAQPFGGEGLSGTGPKAGGPLYLPRLAGSVQLPPAVLPGLKVPAGDALAALPALSLLSAWAASTGRDALAQRCACYAALTLVGKRCELPGPTGERNTLRFAARGVLLCLADDPERQLVQLAAVFASGNDAALGDTAAGRATRALLPYRLATRVALRPAASFAGIAGVVFDGGAETAARLRQRLALHPGPLLPLFVANEGDYPLYRLVVERVESVNTAAVGGDAALIARVA